MNRRPSQSQRNSDRNIGRYRTTPANLFSPTICGKRDRLPFYLRFCISFFLLLLLFNTVLNRLVLVRRITIPVTHLPAALDGTTLLHISDLKGAEFGSRQSGIIAQIRNERIDAVVLTGDMVSPHGNAQPLYDLLDELAENIPGVPVWFIAGDSDPEPVSVQYASEGSCYAPWVLGASRHGARLLRAPIRLNQGEPGLWLIPGVDLSLDLSLEEERFFRLRHDAFSSGDEIQGELARYHLARLSEFRDAQKRIQSEDLCIALFHAMDPSTAERSDPLSGISTYSIDAILSGHWLGGLIHIPYIGPLFIPSVHLQNGGILPGDGYDGLSRLGSVWHYVSPGLGSSDTKYPFFFFRFLNPPSITLVQFLSSSV